MSTSGKRKGERHRNPEAKRRTIDLETKAEMIKQFERGVKISVIAQTYGFAKSTVSSILKVKERILAAEKGSPGMKSCYIRQGPVQEMEKQLISWVEEETQNQVVLSPKAIQKKALRLFAEIKRNYGSDYDECFTASQGWFYRFKKRVNLDDIISCGDVGDVDLKSCEEFKETLDKIITEEKYLPEQIFTCGKTVLFLRKMPEASYFQQDTKYIHAFNTLKDRVSLLFGTNVMGHKLKPLLVYHSENPRAFRNVDKATLPLHYRSNKNSWVSQEIFEDWFLNYFIPEVDEYCADKKVPFKILLLLDTLPCYPQNLNDLNPNVKVVFLPPETSGHLQPIFQGASAIFKASYIRNTFAKAVAATETSDYTLTDFWRDYNVLHAITSIDDAWNDMSQVCLRGIWGNILNPNILKLSEEFVKSKEMEPIFNRIIRLAEELHLEVIPEDINQVVEVMVDENVNDDSGKTEKEDSETDTKGQNSDKPELESAQDERVEAEKETKSELPNALEDEEELPIEQEEIEMDKSESEFIDEGMDESMYESEDKDQSSHEALYESDNNYQSIQEDPRPQTIHQTALQDFGERQLFPLENMYTAFSKINEGLDMFKKMDANFSRYTKVEYLVQKALSVYTDLYREKKKDNPPRYPYYEEPH